MKRILALLVASFLGSPALAKTLYLVQQLSDPCATRIYDTVPVPGTNCPTGSYGGLWTQVNGDQYPGDYVWSVQSNAFIYSPPAPPPDPTDIPNPMGAKAAILQDPNIPSAARVNLFQFAGILPDYTTAPQAVQQAWQDIVSVYGPNGSSPSTWLTQSVINAVTSDCSTNFINLPIINDNSAPLGATGGGSSLGGI